MPEIYFHGAHGDKILKIIQSGVLKPDDGEIFLARFEPENCFMHGADRARRANYVIKVELTISEDVRRQCKETPGVRDTLVLRTTHDIPAAVLELYIRRRAEDDDGFDFDRIIGTQAIVRELNP